MSDPTFPKVIYILRDPRAVLLSYWHYHRMLYETFLQPMEQFVVRDDLWPCRWDEHVLSWLIPEIPLHVCLVTYEDMKADTMRVLNSVLKFAGIEVADDKLLRAVEAASFGKMRDIENKFGSAEQKPKNKERFVRKGQIDSWREEFSDETLVKVEMQFATTMRLFGYETVSI